MAFFKEHSIRNIRFYWLNILTLNTLQVQSNIYSSKQVYISLYLISVQQSDPSCAFQMQMG